MITPAVHSVPRPKKRQGCASMAPPHALFMLNGDGTGGTDAVGRIAWCAGQGAGLPRGKASPFGEAA